jgi:hypothetical protein
MLDAMGNESSVLEEDTHCVGFKSLMTNYKTYLKTYSNKSYPTVSDLNREDFQYFFASDTLRLVATYMGNDFDYFTNASERMISMLPFAFPLQGYKNKADRKKEQEDKLGIWQLVFLKPLEKLKRDTPA